MAKPKPLPARLTLKKDSEFGGKLPCRETMLFRKMTAELFELPEREGIRKRVPGRRLGLSTAWGGRLLDGIACCAAPMAGRPSFGQGCELIGCGSVGFTRDFDSVYLRRVQCKTFWFETKGAIRARNKSISGGFNYRFGRFLCLIGLLSYCRSGGSTHSMTSKQMTPKSL